MTGPTRPSDPPTARAWTVVPAALGLVALGLRLFRADAQSLWYDEGTSAALALRAPAAIVAAAAGDIHPPLYYLALAGWTRLFGHSVVALRGLSAIIGALGVVGLVLLARRLAGGRVAALAGLLAAASPFLVWYGQEVRMYVLAAALAPWLAWLACVLLDGRTPSTAHRRAAAVAAAALTAAALYTHYLAGAAAALAANAVAVAAWAGRARQAPDALDAAPGGLRPAAAWTAAQVAAGLAFLPWLARVAPVLAAWPARGGPMSPADLARGALDTYALGIRAPAAWAAAWPAPAAVAALGLAAGLAHGRTRRAAAAGLALAAVPVLFLGLAGLRRPAWDPKFLVPGAAGFELLSALGLAVPWAAWPGRTGRRARALRLAAAAALAALALTPRLAALGANYYDPATQRDDYRGIAAAIAAAAGPSDAVVLTAPTQIEVFELYDRGAHATYPLPAERPPDAADTARRLEALGAAHRDVFALLWAVEEADPDGLVTTWLDAHRHKAYDRWHGAVRLALWAAERRPTAPAPGLPARFGDALVLRALTHGPLTVAPGDLLTLTADWAAGPAPARPDLTVFLHLVGPDGAPIAQRDMRPVGDTAATSTWAHDDPPVRDRIALALPPELAPGAYRLVLGLYDGATGARLPVETTGGAAAADGALVVGTVRVAGGG